MNYVAKLSKYTLLCLLRFEARNNPTEPFRTAAVNVPGLYMDPCSSHLLEALCFASVHCWSSSHLFWERDVMLVGRL